MAFGDTDVSICSDALLHLGANSISSFSDGTAPAGICKAIYPRVKSQTLAMYAWSFTLTKAELSRTTNTPLNTWTYEYVLPSDMFLGVPRKVYASNNSNAPVTTDYEIQGSKLLSDNTSIVVDYQQLTDEPNMPAYFVTLLVYQMAWHLAEPITDQITKADYWKTVALGTASESFRGGYFRQAINADGAGQSKSVIADYLLTEVR